jgi:chromosome partitioning protein
MRLRVLVIDLDPQVNATETLEASGEFNIFDVLYGGGVGTLGDAVVETSWNGVDAVPGSSDLSRIESESLMAAEMRLKTAAHDASALNKYDVILLDLPPALGRLTLNGLVYADIAIAVTEAQSFSVKGVTEYLDTIQKVKDLPHLNPNLRFGGIIVNKLSAPLTSEHEFQLGELREAFGELLLEPYLPSRTAMQDSSSSRLPLTKLGSRGSQILNERFVEHARKLRKAA